MKLTKYCGWKYCEFWKDKKRRTKRLQKLFVQQFYFHYSLPLQCTSESDENSNSSTRRRRRENNNTLLTSKTLSFENSTDDDENSNSNGFDVVGPTTRKQWSEWVAKPKSPTGGAPSPSPDGREKENQVPRSSMPLITGYFVLFYELHCSNLRDKRSVESTRTGRLFSNLNGKSHG